MPQKNETIPDTTDVVILQPDKLAIRIEEMKFLPLIYPTCKAKMNCQVDFYNWFELFQFFFQDKQIQILVDYTNKNAKKTREIQSAYGGDTDRGRREIRV